MPKNPYEGFFVELNTEGLDPKALEMAKYLCKKKSQEMTEVCVIYHPDCGCTLEHFVVLDRYPMSPKIHHLCPQCNKGCLLEISEPIIFSAQIGGDFSLEELKDGVTTDGPQKPFLDCYKNNNT